MEYLQVIILALVGCLGLGLGIGVGIALGLELAMRLSGDNRTVLLTFARNKINT